MVSVPTLRRKVARMDAHSLRREGPSRLCYAGSVLHAQPRALSTSRSPIQLGAELYGDPSPASDVGGDQPDAGNARMAEVPDVHMDLGHVGIYRGLARAAGLSGEVEQQVVRCLAAQGGGQVEALTADLPAELRGMLRALAEHAAAAMRWSRALPVWRRRRPMSGGAERADRDRRFAAGRFPGLPLYFDLGELRGYHYHTGVVFAALCPALASPSPGRSTIMISVPISGAPTGHRFLHRS